MEGKVLSTCKRSTHAFSKDQTKSIRLLAGLGVEGDAHAGETVKHRSREARDPTQPNLRQVHLIHAELFEELKASGFEISVGQLGKNLTTTGIDLLSLPVDTKLRIGNEATICVTGLRNPCKQLDEFSPGLMAATLDHDTEGNLIRKTGIMGIVVTGGLVKTGDRVTVEFPPQPHKPMERV